MAAIRRSQIQIERDRLEIARLYLKGIIQVDIADRLSMSQQMVSYDLKVVRETWLKSSLVAFNERISIELAKIDNLEIEYWQAWQQSKQVKESNITKVIQKPISTRAKDIEGNPVIRTEVFESSEIGSRQEQMSGNSAFLGGVQWCIDRRLKLFGLDAPFKIDWRQTLPDNIDADEVQQQFLDLLIIAAQENNAASNDLPKDDIVV